MEDLYDENGFFFRQRKGRLNLRKLEAIDLEKVIREVDIDILQQLIENITFSEFHDHDIHYLTDKQIVKLFKVSQLTIEYLLFSQRKLVNNLSDLAKKYSAKKRALYQKRKELVYLKEEATRLQIQLKTKRRNLLTLEKLIETAHNEDEVKPAQQNGHALLKFFVAFPDGKYIELEESSEITVKYLISIINNLLFYEVNNKPKDGRSKSTMDAMKDPKASTNLYDNQSQSIQLYLRGKLLMVNSTLSQNGLATGDTLLATIAGFNEPREESKVEIIREVPQQPKDDLSATKALIEALSSQTNCIQKLAEEINAWKGVVSSAPKEIPRDDTKLIDTLEHRLRMMEQEIRDSLKALPKPDDLKPKLIFGELENDDDGKLNPKFDLLSSQMGQISTAVHSLKIILEDQQLQVNDLRRSLSDRNTSTPVMPNIVIQNPIQPFVQQQPSPVPMASPIIIEKEVMKKPMMTKTEKSIVRSSSNRWNSLPFMTNEEMKVEEKKPEVKTIELVQDVFSPPKKVEEPPPKKVEEPPPKKEEPKPVVIVKEPPKPVVAPPVVKVEEPPPKKDDPIVKIRFPLALNPDLSKVMKFSNPTDPNNGLLIEMKNDPSLANDEIVADLRTKIAMHTNLKIRQVSLILDGKTIKIASDLPPRVSFTLKDIVQYALQGKLLIGFHDLRTMSNAQIDLLFPAFDEEVRKSQELIKKKQPGGMTKQKSIRRDPNDPANKEEDVPELKAITQIRSSLQNLLSELDTVNVLSDTDLKKKRADLESYSSASEIEGFQQARKSVISSLGSMVRVEDDDVVIPSEEYFLERQAVSKSIDKPAAHGKPQHKDVKGSRGGLIDDSTDFDRKGSYRREHKSLRLSEKSYDDYKKVLDASMEFNPKADVSMEDSIAALRKSIQRRSYAEDMEDDEIGDDSFNFYHHAPAATRYNNNNNNNRRERDPYDEKSFNSSRLAISSTDRSSSVSINHPNLAGERRYNNDAFLTSSMTQDQPINKFSTPGDDTLNFSSEQDFSASIPFTMTNNSLLSSTINSNFAPDSSTKIPSSGMNQAKDSNKLLDTGEIRKRADAYERKAKFDLLNDPSSDEEDEVEEEENLEGTGGSTLNGTNNTSNNSQAGYNSTMTDSPFRRLNETNLSQHNNPRSRGGGGGGGGNEQKNESEHKKGSSQAFFPTRYPEEDLEELDEDEYLSMNDSARKHSTSKSRGGGGGAGGNNNNNNNHLLDTTNDVASVHSLALSDSQQNMD